MHRPAESAPPVRGERIEIRPGRGLSVAVAPGDARSDVTVFFAHGGGGNKDQWREQWHALQAQGHRLVAWDMLGHGASDAPRQGSAYAWGELVADQLAVFARFASARNLLVAHSFGSGLALSSLLALPPAPAAPAINAAVLLGTQLQRPLGTGGLLRLPVWLLAGLRPLLAKGFRQRAWHPNAAPALVAYEESVARHNRLGVFKALVAQAAWPAPAALANLDLPVHILAGDHDGLTPAAGGQALAACLPNATFEVVGQCGHQLMLEKPHEVNRSIDEQLARLPAVGAAVVGR